MHDGVLYNIHNDELRINFLMETIKSFKNEHCGHTEGKMIFPNLGSFPSERKRNEVRGGLILFTCVQG